MQLSKRAFGGVLIRDGKVLLREPTNHFDGTVWTFAKGGQHPGESPEETAKREVREETGWNTQIIAQIPGAFAGKTSTTEYFLMEPVGDQGAWQPSETQDVRWVAFDEAPALIARNNPVTKHRDLAVLEAAIALWRQLQAESKPGSASSGLSPVDLESALAAAEEAALAAGQILRGQMFLSGGPEGSGSKAKADVLAERAIRKRLTSQFPRWKWYGEEEGGSHPRTGETGWIVDPNDGTSAYLEGYRGSAVSIALVHNGVPVLGVVYAFAAPDNNGDLISGGEGLPLRRNGVVVSRLPLPEALSSEHVVLFNHKADAAPSSHALACKGARFRAVPSIACRLALVAVGDAAAAVSLSGPTLHDVAGGHALLRSIGGVLVDRHGQQVRYDQEWTSNVFAGSHTVAAALSKASYPVTVEPLADKLSQELGRCRLPPGSVIASSDLLQRAQGCLLGQIAGDSLGQLVEFESAATIKKKYPEGPRSLLDGVGTWNTLAGQPTDDSELALVLARRLAKDGEFNAKSVSAGYRAWLASSPFDVGTTTSRGLRGDALHNSQSNGSLMRISPLGVFGWTAPLEDLVRWARTDSGITHPNPVCRDACAIYAAAIAFAIRTGCSAREVYDQARNVARLIDVEPSVARALAEAEKQPPESYEQNMGWVLIALQNAFWQLLHAPSLQEGVVDTVRRGGDTDTTAAIAGALLGAVHGRTAIPAQWAQSILSCRPLAKTPGVIRPRPEVFWPVDVLPLAERLLIAGQVAQRTSS